MKEHTQVKLMFYFTVVYLFLFTILAVVRGNYEFLFYTVVMSFLIFITLYYRKTIRLSNQLLLGLTILGAMHIFGGNISIYGVKLYDFYFISNILRYDMIVHAFGTFLVTFVVYSLLTVRRDNRVKRTFLFYLGLVLMVMGLGAINEIIELFAVVFLGATNQVGDYINNAFDLVFNLVGAVVASLYIVKYPKRRN